MDAKINDTIKIHVEHFFHSYQGMDGGGELLLNYTAYPTYAFA